MRLTMQLGNHNHVIEGGNNPMIGMRYDTTMAMTHMSSPSERGRQGTEGLPSHDDLATHQIPASC